VNETGCILRYCYLGTIVASVACAKINGAGLGGGSGGGAGTGGSGGVIDAGGNGDVFTAPQDGGKFSAGDASAPSGPPGPRHTIDPSVPAGAVQGFENAGAPTGGSVQVVYPDPDAVVPRDLAAIDVQWNPVTGANAYRVSLSVDTGDSLTGYVSNAHYLPTADDWKWLLGRAAGRSIRIQVQAATLDASGTPTALVRTSAPQSLRVSKDDARFTTPQREELS